MATTTRKRPIKYRRGKPLPLIKHGDQIDLTTFPLHKYATGRSQIERCPKCGRKGEYSRMQNGSESYTHLTEYQTIFWMVKDSCWIEASEALAATT